MAEPITVRRLPFPLPDAIDAMLVEGQPEESFVNVALSLLLPYLEPYLIRSMRAARPHLSDPALAAAVELFIGQEGQHYRQHMRFNAALVTPGREALRALEEELDRDYHRFTDTKSLRFNLAYAEGFEAYTMAVARFSFEVGMIERLAPVARDLYRWHLTEEVEHRTVAFDVYDQVFGGYFYRLVVGWFAQWHLNRFVFRAARAMADADRAGFRAKWGGLAAAWARTRPVLGLALRHLLPKIWATSMPWYTPHRIPMPPAVQALAAEYSARAAEASPKAPGMVSSTEN